MFEEFLTALSAAAKAPPLLRAICRMRSARGERVTPRRAAWTVRGETRMRRAMALTSPCRVIIGCLFMISYIYSVFRFGKAVQYSQIEILKASILLRKCTQNENNMDKTAQLEALVTHFANGNKAKFAGRLGVKPQTISTWMNRNTFDVYLVYAKCDGVSADWLLTGEGSMMLLLPPRRRLRRLPKQLHPPNLLLSKSSGISDMSDRLPTHRVMSIK